MDGSCTLPYLNGKLKTFKTRLCGNTCIRSPSYHIFTVKYVLFTYAIQAQVLCTYRDTISRKLYQFKICQNPYLPREIWTHITPPYHTPNLESCISSKFVKIHISLGRYGLISHPHITPQTSYHISRDPHIRSALFYSIVRCKQGFSWTDFGAHYGPLSQLKKCVKFPNFQVKNPKIINKSLYICCGYVDHTLKIFFSEKYPQTNTKYAYYPLFCFVSIFPI